MSEPIRIPKRQIRAFDRAVAERLGLDPTIIGDDFLAHWTVGDEELGKVKASFTAYLPADEILAMFNGFAGYSLVDDQLPV